MDPTSLHPARELGSGAFCNDATQAMAGDDTFRRRPPRSERLPVKKE